MDDFIEVYRNQIRCDGDKALEWRLDYNRDQIDVGGYRASDKIMVLEAEIARRSGVDSAPASADLAGLIWEIRDAPIG